MFGVVACFIPYVAARVVYKRQRLVFGSSAVRPEQLVDMDAMRCRCGSRAARE